MIGLQPLKPFTKTITKASVSPTFGAKRKPSENGTRSPLLPDEATARQFIVSLQQNDLDGFKDTLSTLGPLNQINPDVLPFQPLLEKLLQLDTPPHPSHLEMLEALIEKGLNPNLKFNRRTPLIWLLAQSHVNAQPVLNTLNRMKASGQQAERFNNNDPSCLSIFLSFVGRRYTERKGTNKSQATQLLNALLQVSEPIGKLEKREVFQRILQGFGNNPKGNEKEARNMPWPEAVQLVLSEPYHWDVPPEGLSEAYKAKSDSVFRILLQNLNGPNQDRLSHRDLGRLVVLALSDSRTEVMQHLMGLPNLSPLTRQQAMEKAIDFNCSPEMLSAILSNGQVNPSAISKLWPNISTLHVLASNNRFDIMDRSDAVEPIERGSPFRLLRDQHLERLLTAPELANVRINVNVIDPDQNTPLMYACMAGNVSAARLLLEAGANPHLKNEIGHTPLDWVKRFQHHWPESTQGAMLRLIEGYSQK